MATTDLAPLVTLFRDGDMRSLEGTARIFFTNSALTINTLPAAIGVTAMLGGLAICRLHTTGNLSNYHPDLMLVNPFTFWNGMMDGAVDYMTSGGDQGPPNT